MYYQREIEERIIKNLFKGMIVTIYGARQVGKTTLVKKLLAELLKVPAKYVNCDERDIRKEMSERETSVSLREFVGNNKLVVFDEAQRIKDIGVKLKLLVDNYPEIQIIVIGSSSFELSNEVIEPLTGRNIEFWLYPLSLKELAFEDKLAADRHLESLLIFGSYPKVFSVSGVEEKTKHLNGIVANYLYKDILKFQSLRNSEIVQKLLEALALQIGNEVSYGELATLVGISKETVRAYIELLEKVFIVFRLRPFSRNLRKELSKLRKIYFYDLGVRNALIRNLNPLSLRDDVGKLWENFVISERKKKENYIGNLTNLFFWRTYDGQEIDLVEERGGTLSALEIKWQKALKAAPKAWREGYKKSSWEVVTKDNYFALLGP